MPCTIALNVAMQGIAPLRKHLPPIYSAQIMCRGKIMTHYETQHPLVFTRYINWSAENEPIKRGTVTLIINN